jgi:UDP-N-acetylmuramate dehydrogenase
VYLNRLRGRRLGHPEGTTVLVEAAAGENWDGLVRWSLRQGLSGLENLSLIPGLAGAAPVQNIGAYGVELADVLESVCAWDWTRGDWRVFSNEECRLSYRDSRFKSEEADRFLITSIRLRLSTVFHPKLDYAGIREQLAKTGVAKPGAIDVCEAVTTIRQQKLPDPAVTPNAGSFFKNPLVSTEQAHALQLKYPGLPAWPGSHHDTKLSAAWMIEHCGWRGHRKGEVGVSEQHALVLVNHGNGQGADVLNLADAIIDSVRQEFGVCLMAEPKIVQYR